MVKKIIILGTGGSSVDVLDTISDINASSSDTLYQCAGFLDDDPQSWCREICGIKVLGPLDSADLYRDCHFVNGIGSPGNYSRKPAILARVDVPLERFETIIHPSASVSSLASLGRGTVIFQNVTITSNVRIGNHVIILPNSVISHDTFVGDYTCITAGVCISGSVTIGRCSYLGTNATVLESVTIGDGCLIGMGSVVLEPVADHSVVVGNPARLLRYVFPEVAEKV